jgi:uncharacterized protein (TIGR02302 family)
MTWLNLKRCSFNRNHISATHAPIGHLRLANAMFAVIVEPEPVRFAMIEDAQIDTTPRLAPARRSAWFALFWEKLWPLMLPILGIVALFLTVSWFGVWSLLHDYVRIGFVAVFGAAFVFALSRLRKLQLPTSAQVDARIERVSLLEHRPVTAQEDSRSDVSGDNDAFANVLWEEHRRRMAQSLSGLKSGTPSPKVAQHDPFALRALVLLALFVAFGFGWNNWSGRVADAFRSQPDATLVAGRVDVWVTPPAYTNKPPIFLKQSTSAEQAAVTVPEGSELVVRVLKLDAPELVLLDGEYERVIDAVVPESKRGSQSQVSEEEVDASQISTAFKLKLEKTSSVKLRSGEDEVGTWSFAVTEDHNPSIKFVEDPEGSTRGALEFSYEVQDDYGVSTARAEIKSETDIDSRAVPLVEAPQIDLPLPKRNATKGVSKTSQDLTSHPWAGAKVQMTLIAEDEAGQRGESAAKSFVLPQRVFTKPLAKAIVHERRNLALDLRNAAQVAEMLDIITNTHPDTFIKDFSVYTALRVAYRSIRRTRDKDELRETLDLMWETALAVEDGDLSLAERRLRDAQERLAEALENGASDEEIAELMQDLRNAMNEFMQELAQQAQRNQQNQQAMPLDPNTQVLRQQDLERMMQQIEDLAKSGSKDAARQLLEEMQRMMNNLQTARPQQQQQRQQTDEFSQQMNKLGEMMRQQQQLMDQTLDMQRQQQRRGEQGEQQGQQNQQQQQQQGDQNQPGERKPMTPEEFAEAMKQLQEQQGQLQQQMQELQEAMRGLGMEPGEQLGEAGEAMGGAEQSLGEGQTGEAMGEQGRALQAMREGAQQMMQNMQNQAGEQGRQGERGQHGEQSSGDRDPLGRQSRSNGPQLGDDTKVPDEIDAQRAREILDAIRRKLSDTARPKLELDYLDRLLPTR